MMMEIMMTMMNDEGRMMMITQANSLVMGTATRSNDSARAICREQSIRNQSGEYKWFTANTQQERQTV